MQSGHGGGHSGFVVLRDAERLERLLHGIGDVRLVDSRRDEEACAP